MVLESLYVGISDLDLDFRHSSYPSTHLRTPRVSLKIVATISEILTSPMDRLGRRIMAGSSSTSESNLKMWIYVQLGEMSLRIIRK